MAGGNEETNPIFFLDRAIDGPFLADALIAAGADLRRHSIEYPDRGDIEDAAWLREVGEKGWFVLRGTEEFSTALWKFKP